MTNKFRDEGINIPRDTVCRKFRQIENVSKVPVEDHELLLQQNKVRLKWCKKYRNKEDWVNEFFTEEKTFKTGNKKKRRWMKKGRKNYQVNANFEK